MKLLHKSRARYFAPNAASPWSHHGNRPAHSCFALQDVSSHSLGIEIASVVMCPAVPVCKANRHSYIFGDKKTREVINELKSLKKV